MTILEACSGVNLLLLVFLAAPVNAQLGQTACLLGHCSPTAACARKARGESEIDLDVGLAYLRNRRTGVKCVECSYHCCE